MAEPTKEQRLKALLAQEPEPRKPAEGRHIETPRVQTRDLGEVVLYRKCSRIRCSEFANTHPILGRAEETLVHALDGNRNVLDLVENSTVHYHALDEEDTRCPECGTIVGFVVQEKGILADVNNPDFGVSNDREAVIQARTMKKLPLPEWAQREIAKANLEVQRAVKES
jgi:hypothetical protein